MNTVSPRRALRRALPAAAVVLGLGAPVAIAANAHAATTTDYVRVAPSDDTYSTSSRPTVNMGQVGKLVTGRLAGDTTVTYLKFKVGALPSGATLNRVKVKLTRDEHRLPGTVRLHKVTSTSWTESTLTQRTAPAPGTVVQTLHPQADWAGVEFDVTSVVRGPGTYAFAVTTPATNDVARFRSDEYGPDGPVLALTVTRPAPVTSPSSPKPSSPKPSSPAPSSPAPKSPAPTTPAPTTPAPTTPAPTPSTPAECTVDAKLVPSCNILWGAAAGGFSDTPRDQALREWEAKTGRHAQVYHTYHKGDELFPTTAERAMAREAGRQRVLMLNWKVAYGSNWAAVARGEQDARIDRLAAHIKATFPEKFFMVLHHEPENDVNTDATKGMTAKDYAAMYRHTANRLKAQGVSNAVFVMAYMNYEKWNNLGWWWELYPGDDVVDWVGIDSYVAAEPGTFHHGDFRYLMDRTTDRTKFPGWYTWATTYHPGKPVMVAEWGVHECATTCDPLHKARVFDTVLPQLATLPAVKGLVYFDTARDQNGHDIRVDSSPQSLEAFKRIAADPRFNVKLN